MEASKKQSNTIGELETELLKARKQERAYDEAMEQLQADLDALEQDNAKLKTIAAPEIQGTRFTVSVMPARSTVSFDSCWQSTRPVR